MQNLFFDTSALVKRYYDEPGTEFVDSLVTDEDTKVVLTSIAVIETVSAFRRKYNRDGITASVLDDLLASFFEEALSDFLILPTEESLLVNSFELVLEDDLRTLDSLQLSAALSVSENVEDFAFVSADKELVSVAESKGLEAINPDEAES
jgi:predicted nucleic acid-binding protein